MRYRLKYYKNKVIKYLYDHEPSFLIIGAQKAGTTSLHYYLDQHPNLIGSIPKEVRFFDRDENYAKGVDWYKRSFRRRKGLFRKCLYFEATPEYLYRPYVAKRIFEYNRDIKLIILLRDPVERAYSSWNMYRHFLVSKKGIPDILTRGYLKGASSNNIYEELYRGKFPSFQEVVESELRKIKDESPILEPSFLRRGIYYPQIKRYVDLFGSERIFIVAFKDLVGDSKRRVLNDILDFLGLPKSTWSFLSDEKMNAREYPEVMESALFQRLHEFYQPHNEQLFNYLGYKPNW